MKSGKACFKEDCVSSCVQEHQDDRGREREIRKKAVRLRCPSKAGTSEMERRQASGSSTANEPTGVLAVWS